MSEVLIVIPARYGSTRLPGKALKLLAGKPVVQHVWQACVKAGVGEVLIATENQIVVDAAAQFGAKAVLTSESCQSGTDRVYEAAQNRPERIIINVQGDEPFIAPSTVQKIARLLQADPQCDIASAVAPTLDENLAFFQGAYEDGSYIGISNTNNAYNRYCAEHENPPEETTEETTMPETTGTSPVETTTPSHETTTEKSNRTPSETTGKKKEEKSTHWWFPWRKK